MYLIKWPVSGHPIHCGEHHPTIRCYIIILAHVGCCLIDLAKIAFQQLPQFKTAFSKNTSQSLEFIISKSIQQQKKQLGKGHGDTLNLQLLKTMSSIGHLGVSVRYISTCSAPVLISCPKMRKTSRTWLSLRLQNWIYCYQFKLMEGSFFREEWGGSRNQRLWSHISSQYASFSKNRF